MPLVKCPSCGAPAEESAVYCGGCGLNLTIWRRKSQDETNLAKKPSFAPAAPRPRRQGSLPLWTSRGIWKPVVFCVVIWRVLCALIAHAESLLAPTSFNVVSMYVSNMSFADANLFYAIAMPALLAQLVAWAAASRFVAGMRASDENVEIVANEITWWGRDVRVISSVGEWRLSSLQPMVSWLIPWLIVCPPRGPKRSMHFVLRPFRLGMKAVERSRASGDSGRS